MPRGKRKRENLTLEEQLAAVESQISETEEQLNELKSKQKELSQAILEAQKEEMYRKVMESGRSIEEILEALSNTKDA